MPAPAPLELAQFKQIVIMTGAGVSVASGLPTYRGVGGIWGTVDVGSHATAAAIATDPGGSKTSELAQQLSPCSRRDRVDHDPALAAFVCPDLATPKVDP